MGQPFTSRQPLTDEQLEELCERCLAPLERIRSKQRDMFSVNARARLVAILRRPPHEFTHEEIGTMIHRSEKASQYYFEVSKRLRFRT